MRSAIILFGVCLLLSVACEDRSIAVSAETQLAIDKDKIDTYLAEKGIIAQQHVSGLRYVITQQGTGEKPTAEKCIRVNYTLWFLGETDAFDQQSAFATPLVQTILGWRIGMKELQKGGKMTLYVPSGLAYGPAGRRTSADSSIPANQCLVFDVELLNLTTYNAAGAYCNPWP
jgi:FKBP-type peptidyl-prolyl cis-trans isomerase FkpA